MIFIRILNELFGGNILPVFIVQSLKTSGYNPVPTSDPLCPSKTGILGNEQSLRRFPQRHLRVCAYKSLLSWKKSHAHLFRWFGLYNYLTEPQGWVPQSIKIIFWVPRLITIGAWAVLYRAWNWAHALGWYIRHHFRRWLSHQLLTIHIRQLSGWTFTYPPKFSVKTVLIPTLSSAYILEHLRYQRGELNRR